MMGLLAVLLVVLPGQAVARKPPPPPGAEVAMEAQAVLVPPLPVSVAEARKGYPRVRKDLEAAYREADRYLAACTAELAELGQPEGQLTLPDGNGEEARFLTPYLFDGAFLALEEPLLERWNGWQSTLLSLGMAEPHESQRMAERMLLLSSSKSEVVDRTSVKGGFEILMEGSVLRLPRHIKWIEVMAVDRMNYGAHTDFGVRATTMADAQARELAKAWTPLTEHLNKGAAALLDLDRTARPTRDPALRALRLQARINFMERFRSTLWFCQVIWAHMASERVLPIRQM